MAMGGIGLIMEVLKVTNAERAAIMLGCHTSEMLSEDTSKNVSMPHVGQMYYDSVVICELQGRLLEATREIRRLREILRSVYTTVTSEADTTQREDWLDTLGR